MCFWVPCSTHPWFAPDALGQAYFLPWCCRVPGMPTCSGCSAQCTLCWHVRATCSSARHRWHVTGMPPGCGGQPRACPSLQLAAARPRAAEEEGWMGTGRGARRGRGGAHWQLLSNDRAYFNMVEFLVMQSHVVSKRQNKKAGI